MKKRKSTKKGKKICQKSINSTNTVAKQNQYTEKHHVITWTTQGQLSFQHQQLLTCGPAIDLEAFFWRQVKHLSVKMSSSVWQMVSSAQMELIPHPSVFFLLQILFTKLRNARMKANFILLHRLSNACTVLIYAGPSCQRRTALFPTQTAADLPTCHRSGGHFWWQVKHLSVKMNSSVWKMVSPAQMELIPHPSVFFYSRFCLQS